MMFLGRPRPEAIGNFLERCEGGALTYEPEGASRHAPPGPEGYTLDHNPIQLGRGKQCYQRAKQAVREWRMFDFPWVNVHYSRPGFAPVREGTIVGVLAHPFPLPVYFLNAARIVYVQDGPDAGSAREGPEAVREVFGFAYGTLADHVESGEERFTVEWRRDDTVWYNLLAFSRPHFWYVRLGYPVTRHLQKRFARESKRAMQRATAP